MFSSRGSSPFPESRLLFFSNGFSLFSYGKGMTAGLSGTSVSFASRVREEGREVVLTVGGVVWRWEGACCWVCWCCWTWGGAWFWWEFRRRVDVGDWVDVGVGLLRNCCIVGFGDRPPSLPKRGKFGKSDPPLEKLLGKLGNCGKFIHSESFPKPDRKLSKSGIGLREGKLEENPFWWFMLVLTVGTCWYCCWGCWGCCWGCCWGGCWRSLSIEEDELLRLCEWDCPRILIGMFWNILSFRKVENVGQQSWSETPSGLCAGW